MSVIRIHYHFVGRVQGVGFRYTAYYSATRHGVTGFVKNEDDGSVTMEVQGTEEQINMVLEAINRGMYIQIENMESHVIPVESDERGFRTEYE